jgi:hypothetical protein
MNNTGTSEITNCKNCKEYEVQLREALEELTSTQMINNLLHKEFLSQTTTLNTWKNDLNPPTSTRNSVINNEWTLVTDKSRKVKAKNKYDKRKSDKGTIHQDHKSFHSSNQGK